MIPQSGQTLQGSNLKIKLQSLEAAFGACKAFRLARVMLRPEEGLWPRGLRW